MVSPGSLTAALKSTKYRIVFIVFIIAVSISLITRSALLLSFSKSINGSFGNITAAFFIGLLYDSLSAALLLIPLTLHICFSLDFIYSRKGAAAIPVFFSVLFLLFFSGIFPKEYSALLYRIIEYYLLLRFIIFLMLYFTPHSFRLQWRTAVLRIFCFVIIFLLVLNAVSEWFFWNEFSSRYNFIAVDYLVYTNEVLGNIRESYPLWLILPMTGIVAAFISIPVFRLAAAAVRTRMRFLKRLAVTAAIMVTGLLLIYIVPGGWKYFSSNNYVNELAGNGMYDFVRAFNDNELDYYTYYSSIPDTAAFKNVREAAQQEGASFISDNVFETQKKITCAAPENKMNVVIITIESLSASFMRTFGNTENITPSLDSLAAKGMLFTNMYAAGTRTVRGLEAITLSLPPLPGESIIKRPGNENLFSLGAVFKSKGYSTQFLYGGYSYFDNMNYFFGHNGYEVIDRTSIDEKNIHYANIWGVADEDLFTLSLKTFDKDHDTGKPFFAQIMTVSNHRPYTYPAGRIDISPEAQSRNGAVKYTDYAIGRFIREASVKPWFSNTIFVIVADHCASSAGKQELPVSGYHIPLIIYSPGNIAPQNIGLLTGQLDIGPTILGLLRFNYTSQFFGQDVFHTAPRDLHAFISTYRGLGYFKHDTLIVQQPVKKLEAYAYDSATQESARILVNKKQAEEAISYYQSAAWLIKNKKFHMLNYNSGKPY